MRGHQVPFTAMIAFPIALLASCSSNVPRVAPNDTSPLSLASPTNSAPVEPTLSFVPRQIQEVTETDVESILMHSTEIDDPLRDWISTGNQGDNPGIYPVDSVDIKKLVIGMDERYLYIKVVVDAAFPREIADLPAFGGDRVRSVAYNVGLDIDNNSKTGCISDGGTEAIVGYGVKEENGRFMTYSQYFTDPTGIESPEDARYRNRVFGIQIQFGGEGKDYHIVAIPLNQLRIAKDQELTTNAWAEAGGSRYHHASFDILCPEPLMDKTRPMICPISFRVGQEGTVK